MTQMFSCSRLLFQNAHHLLFNILFGPDCKDKITLKSRRGYGALQCGPIAPMVCTSHEGKDPDVNPTSGGLNMDEMD